jgi:hypothetical protein
MRPFLRPRLRANIAELGLTIRPRYIISPVLAALVYLGVYAVVGWTLDTSRAIVTTAAVNAALAFSVSLWLPPKASLLAAISEFVGMFGASVILLFVLGPGNLFPIVVLVLGALFAISTGVGWSLALPLNWGLALLKKGSRPSLPRLV